MGADPQRGEVPERSIGTVSKTVVRVTVPWVRIPPSPPRAVRPSRASCRPPISAVGPASGEVIRTATVRRRAASPEPRSHSRSTSAEHQPGDRDRRHLNPCHRHALHLHWKGEHEGWLMTPRIGLGGVLRTLPGLARFVSGRLPGGLMTARTALKTICHQDGVPFGGRQCS
jgi:hypothetical protein